MYLAESTTLLEHDKLCGSGREAKEKVVGMATYEAGLTLVSDEGRGRDIAERQDALGLSDRRLAVLAGVDRSSVEKARAGQAKQDRIYRQLEQALEDEESRRAAGAPEPAATEDDVDTSQYIEVKLAGNFGITATVKGPVDHPDELQRMLSAILQEMRGEPNGEDS